LPESKKNALHSAMTRLRRRMPNFMLSSCLPRVECPGSWHSMWY